MRAMKLSADGYNEHGVALCECGNKRLHAWEPGEWCSPYRVISAQPKSEKAKPSKVEA